MNHWPSKTIRLALLAGGVVAGACWWVNHESAREEAAAARAEAAEEARPDSLSSKYARFEAVEKQITDTALAPEIEAQRHGRVIEDLWDGLNASTNMLAALAGSIEFRSLILGDKSIREDLSDGISQTASSGPAKTLSPDECKAWAGRLEKSGWQLTQCEFRHTQFDPAKPDQPAKSLLQTTLNLVNDREQRCASLQGELRIEWAPDGTNPPRMAIIDASSLRLLERQGPPGFKLILSEEIPPLGQERNIDPLIVRDLDGDGVSEIILVARNLVYRLGDDGVYKPGELCRHPTDVIHTAVMEDFDGDGRTDLLVVRYDGLTLFRGGVGGVFDQPGELVWKSQEPLKSGMALTCGDIDGDGDLDLFLGQYRAPDLGQLLRPYYYDANDGFPSFLFQNDGHGGFMDVTACSGLERKRKRRVYSAMLADLDGDGNLDLSLVSDFAGIDLFHNDGHGRFQDVTAEWVADPKAFGMGQAWADFDRDGRLDLLLIGMNSPTAERLEHGGIWRPDATEDRSMRRRMTHGNRLFMGKSGTGFTETSLGAGLSRAGWSWGCSAFDFNNDGFPDLYIANGNETGKSVRDYEGEFWLRDIYLQESLDDQVTTTYLTRKFAATRGSGWSYGGHEPNRLYLNRAGKSFLEVGHLMGVAAGTDSRSVVAADLDGDGRPDLTMTMEESRAGKKRIIQVYRNELPASGHWIGFRLNGGPNQPDMGATVTLRTSEGTTLRQVVSGDSYRSQHSGDILFGLGAQTEVEEARIRWTHGGTLTLRRPGIDRFHPATPSGQGSGPESR